MTFLHMSCIVSEGFRCLEEGEKVSFTYVEESGKKKALEIKKLTESENIGEENSDYESWPEGVMPTQNKQTGYVKWYNTEKGFGFIVTYDSDSTEYFVHHSEIYREGFRSLKTGEAVEFYIAESKGQFKAIDVHGPGGVEVKGAPRRSK